MADYSMYHALGQGEQLDPNDPNRTRQPAPPQFQPPIAQQPYQQGAGYNAPSPQGQHFYGQPPSAGPSTPGFGPPSGGPGYAQGQPPPPPPGQMGTLADQMGGMSLGADPHAVGTTRKKKKDRHAFHTVEAPLSSGPMAFNGMPPPGPPGAPGAGFISGPSVAAGAP